MAAEGKHAPWRLWILIVLWVLQFLLLGYSLIVYIMAIVVVNSSDYARFSGSSIAWIAVSLAVVVLSIALTIAEAVQTGRRSLTPLFYLISNTTKAVIWTALTVTSVVLSRDSLNDSRATVGITVVVTLILLLFFILPMIYGIIIMIKHRKRRGTPYKSVDPLLNTHTAYSAQAGAPGNIELESGLPHQGAYNPQKDTRFESYRQSAVPAEAYGAAAPSYGQAAPSYGHAMPYDGSAQQHQYVQHPQQTGYVS